MTSLTNSLAIIPYLVLSTNALIREEKRPVHTSSMTIENTTHTEHTTDKDGNFSHPFHQVADDV